MSDFPEDHDDELRELPQACADCGAEVYGAGDRAFEFGADQLLCWQCAERRGGSYDAHQERWSEPPDVRDLRARGGRDPGS